MDNATKFKTLRLLMDMWIAVDEYLDAVSNGESPSDEPYNIAEELLEHGIGGVLCPKLNGKNHWFSLEDMEFKRLKPSDMV